MANCRTRWSRGSRARSRPRVDGVFANGGRRGSANGATVSGLKTACAVEFCCRSHCPSPSCPSAAANGLDPSATSWQRARPSLTAPMPIVSPDHGDVRWRRGRELCEELNTTHTRSLGLESFWCCAQPAAFLFFFFTFYWKEIQQRSGSCRCSLRLCRVSIPTPASALTSVSQASWKSYSWPTASYAHGCHNLELMRC